MEQGFTDHLNAIRNEQTSFRQWATEQFSRVVRTQRRYGGTIPSALVRQDRTEQARRNQHETAAAIQQAQANNVNQAQQAQALLPIQQNGANLDAALIAVTPRPAFIPTRSISLAARLMENVRSLSDLWEEYRMGHGDYKPAKDFTRDEINGQGAAFKNKYSRRMKVWRVQSYLVN
jgi:hypothetical protein